MADAPPPRRVLLAVSVLGHNGITAHVVALAQGLLERGWEVGLVGRQVAGRGEAAAAAVRAAGGAVFESDLADFARSRASRVAQAWRSASELTVLARQFQPDVLHIHGLGLSPLARVARRKAGVPYVSTLHVTPPARTRAWVRRLAYVGAVPRWLAGDRAVAISRDMEAELRGLWKLRPDQIRYIPHGIDPTRFRPPDAAERAAARAAFGVAPDAFVVCLLGRLLRTKGHDVLIEALRELRAGGRPVVALCAGDGPLREALAREAAAAGLGDAFRLLGHTDARDVLWASDALALPSRREGFALVVPEAMLCGVVVVRTPAAGAAEQVADGVTGRIVPFDDPSALARALAGLADAPAQRAEMAARARAHAAGRFTLDRMVADTASLYEEVALRRPSRPS